MEDAGRGIAAAAARGDDAQAVVAPVWAESEASKTATGQDCVPLPTRGAVDGREGVRLLRPLGVGRVGRIPEEADGRNAGWGRGRRHAMTPSAGAADGEASQTDGAGAVSVPRMKILWRTLDLRRPYAAASRWEPPLAAAVAVDADDHAAVGSDAPAAKRCSVHHGRLRLRTGRDLLWPGRRWSVIVDLESGARACEMDVAAAVAARFEARDPRSLSRA